MARILLIEDDAPVAEALRHLLLSGGHDVTLAPNGRPAIRLHKEAPFDLIISDIIMPEMEGIETIRALRCIGEAVPIIAISGGANFGPAYLLNLASAFGCSATFEKPVHREPFLAKIEELLAASRN